MLVLPFYRWYSRSSETSGTFSVYTFSTLGCSHSQITTLFSFPFFFNPFLDLHPFASHLVSCSFREILDWLLKSVFSQRNSAEISWGHWWNHLFSGKQADFFLHSVPGRQEMNHTFDSRDWLILQLLCGQNQFPKILEQERRICFLSLKHKSTHEDMNFQMVISSLLAGTGV